MGEMLDLLGSVENGSSPMVTSGYVDVLGDRDPIGPSPGQQVFRKKGLTRIYEGLWRPIVSRVFFGLRGPRAAEEMDLVLGMLGVSPGDRVIDVGCGPGNYTRRLAVAAGTGLVVGTDASAAMVEAAARRDGAKNSAYLRADASALPFDGETFDLACCVGVIHLVEDPMATLDEIVRVLAPGGRLAIMATCARGGRPRHVRGGVTVFARDEMPAALRGRGLVDVDQRVVRRGQFISASKPLEDPVGR
jgi:SAM-dependent methyltransferase